MLLSLIMITKIWKYKDITKMIGHKMRFGKNN